MKQLFGILILTLSCAAAAQVTYIGGPAPTCAEFLKAEKVEPNLIIVRGANVSGRFTDVSGAAIPRSRVELRKDKKTLLVRETDDAGRFTLGDVSAGEYRLIVREDRAFKQATALECSAKGKCELSITLSVNPTDQPGSYCPPQ